MLLKAIGIETDAEAMLMIGKSKHFEVRMSLTSRFYQFMCSNHLLYV